MSIHRKQRPWFRISLIDCNGQNLATWSYDPLFPLIPPIFTYPNEDYLAPYIIQFQHFTMWSEPLKPGIDINLAIHLATQEYISKLLAKEKEKS